MMVLFVTLILEVNACVVRVMLVLSECLSS